MEGSTYLLMSIVYEYRVWKPLAIFGRSATIALVLGLALAACGGSFVYINHVNSSGGDSYLKVPSSWTVFNQSQIFKASSGQLPLTTLRKLEAQSWSNIIAGKKGATLAGNAGLSSPIPYGITQQIELTPAQTSSVSVASLRAVLLPSDPLAVGNNLSGFSYQVMAYHELSLSGGFQGSVMEVRIIGSKGQVSVLDQKAMLDSQKKWIYFIGVGCTAACFSSNKGTIEEIVNSWSVKES